MASFDAKGLLPQPASNKAANTLLRAALKGCRHRALQCRSLLRDGDNAVGGLLGASPPLRLLLHTVGFAENTPFTNYDVVQTTALLSLHTPCIAAKHK